MEYPSDITYTVFAGIGRDVFSLNAAPQPPEASASATKKVVQKTSNRRTKKCKDCKYRDSEEKLLKHAAFFCDKENNKWWNIKISRQFQQCTIKGGFGTAFCRYKLQANTFTFEIYTDIPSFQLDAYTTSVHLKVGKTNKAQKALDAEYEAEHDWKLTMKNWDGQGFGENFRMKVNIMCDKS